MAKIQDKTHHDHQSKHKTSSPFLCCFGFSGKIIPEKKKLENDMMTKKINNSGSDHDDDLKIKKKVMVRFYWPRLRLKSPSGAKTVPVLYTTVPEKPQKDCKIYWSSKPKSKSKPKPKAKPEKLPSKLQAPSTNSQPPNEIEIVVPVASDPSPKQNPLETKSGSAKNINLENRKNSSPSLHSSKDDTRTIQKRLSFSRKIESIKAGSSQPGSPVQAKLKQGRTIRQSDSFAAGPNRDKPQVAPTKPERWRSEPAFARRFEPVVGMSVVMVTLLIMVMWGRLCAILCTSAWLYFVPRLSSAVDSDGGALGRARDLDLGSKECKKKVVFEGFLERDNHRINS